MNDTRIRVALGQLNCVVGDLEGNLERIARAAEEAARLQADILVTPELGLTGYPPEDLLLRPQLYAECDALISRLAKRLSTFAGLHVVVGHPLLEQGHRYNAASVLRDGEVIAVYRKRELPNYDVFDERRYFSPAEQPCLITVKGTVFAINICEDTWFDAAPAAARAKGAQVLLAPNASPYHIGKEGQRQRVMKEHVSRHGMSLVYANLVGGQDELVFDGGSFVMDAQGEVISRAPQFESCVQLVEFDGPQPVSSSPLAPVLTQEEEVYRALVLGVRDYLDKNGFPGAIIGLSGGVDSALTLAVAVDALGADRVRAVMMPSAYTAEISWVDARDMARRLGVQYEEINIAPMVAAFGTALASAFAGMPEDATEENIQARIRGTLLMALSNKTGRIVLTTGNKSEMATGYCTLYGDMAGGFAVIKDVLKTLVYRVSHWRNATTVYRLSSVIPERILTRPPSAELRPDQVDQDSLPPYDILDGIIRRYMEEDESVRDIIAQGFDEPTVRRVARLIRVNEYKRRQAPVGIRITHRAFGRDWRYPITNRFHD